MSHTIECIKFILKNEIDMVLEILNYCEDDDTYEVRFSNEDTTIEGKIKYQSDCERVLKLTEYTCKLGDIETSTSVPLMFSYLGFKIFGAVQIKLKFNENKSMLIKFTENKFGHMSLLVYDIRLIMFNNETYSQPGLSFVINVPQEPRKLR